MSLARQLRILFAALACLHLLGGPLAMLQCVAWSQMLLQYSRADGITKAVEDTFSGKRPCKLCCKISRAREEDRERQGPGLPAENSPRLRQEWVASGTIRCCPPRALDLCFALAPEPCPRPGRGADAPAAPPPRQEDSLA